MANLEAAIDALDQAVEYLKAPGPGAVRAESGFTLFVSHLRSNQATASGRRVPAGGSLRSPSSARDHEELSHTPFANWQGRLIGILKPHSFLHSSSVNKIHQCESPKRGK